MHTNSFTKNLLPHIKPRLAGKDIICISSMPYGEMWTRKQRLMTHLAQMGNKVLYVEPSNPLFTSQGDKGGFGSTLEKIIENLYVLKPFGRLPLALFSVVSNLNLRIYANAIKRAAAKINIHHPMIFTYLPVINAHSPFQKLMDYLEGSPLIYDCVDEHSETIGYTPEVAALVHQWDLELTAKADLVFVTAQGLYQARQHLNRKLYLSPNGVDVAHFSKALMGSTKIPADLASIAEPRVGFVGSLSDWIDYGLIARVAKRYPDYNLVLIGPLKRGLKPLELEGLPNVHFLGKKSLEELPGYMKGLACGINPFKKVGIAEKVNPLKVYEYLAAGLPVISVDMPEVRPLMEVIFIARSDEEFIKAVENVVTGRFKLDTAKAAEVLNRHDWDIIFSDLIERVAETASC